MNDPAMNHRHQQNCKYKQQTDRMTRTTLSAIRKQHFTLSGTTHPVIEVQQAILQDYVGRLEFKVRASV